MSNLPPDSATILALRKITKARQVLEGVVISSESFDYRKARKGLIELQKIIRELSREEARLRASFPSNCGAEVVPFPGTDRSVGDAADLS